MVDITGFQLSQTSKRHTAVDALTLLLDELDLYQPGLSSRPAMLAVNKVDCPEARELYREFRRDLREVISKRSLSIKTVGVTLWRVLVEVSFPFRAYSSRSLAVSSSSHTHTHTYILSLSAFCLFDIKLTTTLPSNLSTPFNFHVLTSGCRDCSAQVVPISARDGFGLPALRAALRDLLEQQLHRAPSSLRDGFENALLSSPT